MKLELQFTQNDRATGFRRRVSVFIDGQRRTADEIKLDSPFIKTQMANQWAKQYGVDKADCLKELDRLASVAVDQAAERQKHRAADPPQQRVSAIVDKFLAGLQPILHRKGRSIWFEGLKREVPLGQLWTLAGDQQIVAVANTVEGAELFRATDYRKRVAIFKDACALAGPRLLKTLPELADVKKDPTINAEELWSRVEAWALAPRTFKSDAGVPVMVSYFDWAGRLVPGEPWRRCYASAVFGRASTRRPEIAVKGSILVADLHYRSPRRLAADLRGIGLARTDTIIRVAGKVWRAWALSDNFIDSIATANDLDQNKEHSNDADASNE